MIKKSIITALFRFAYLLIALVSRQLALAQVQAGTSPNAPVRPYLDPTTSNAAISGAPSKATQAVPEKIKPSPTPKTPVPAINRAVTEDTKPKTSSFEVNPFYSLFSITSLDLKSGTTAELASNYYAGADFAYFQKWNDYLKVFVHLKLAAVGFETPASGNGSTDSANKFMSGVGIGTFSKLNSRMALVVFANYEKMLFVRAVSTNVATVDAINIPDLGFQIDWTLFQAYPLSFGVGTMVSVDFPGSSDFYDTSTGMTYGGRLFLRRAQRATAFNPSLELGIYRRSQNTSASQQHDMNIVAGFKFPMGGK